MKIMLDECVTQKAAHAVISFLETDEDVVQVVFSCEYGRQGAKDWEIGTVAGAEGWFVITGDQDKARKNEKKRLADGPPLSQILPLQKVSAVYLSGAIQNSVTNEKARAIISAWPDIKKFFKGARAGSRAILHKKSGGFSLMIS